jgi:NAD(P)-dependent dehydrogenase (short-subunit alcohol dehydrogenase family)
LSDNGHRRINALAPEAIDSPLIDRMVELDANINREAYIATRPNFRLLDIDEVLYPIEFLLSNKSTGINGQIIILGGVK